MKQFTYVVADPLGIHARPAGLLAKEAAAFPGVTVTLSKGNQSARAGQLMKLMGLGVKQGDRITVTVEGPAEAEAAEALHRFLTERL